MNNDVEEGQQPFEGENKDEIKKEVKNKIQQKKFPRPFPDMNTVSGSYKGPGVAPALIGGGANSNSGSGMIGSNERSMGRFTLVNAWNAQALRPEWNGYKSGITPFRQQLIQEITYQDKILQQVDQIKYKEE